MERTEESTKHDLVVEEKENKEKDLKTAAQKGRQVPLKD